MLFRSAGGSWSAESEAGLIGAGAEGARPQRASATFHLPGAASGPAQRLRNTPQNLHTPEKVRGHPLHQHHFICTTLHLTNFDMFVVQVHPVLLQLRKIKKQVLEKSNLPMG